MKVYGQLEKAQAENTTSDTGSLPKGMITYRTDLNVLKVSNGTSMLAMIDESTAQTMTNKTLTSPILTGPQITSGGALFTQIATPSTPSSGVNKLYFKSDGQLYSLGSDGIEQQIGSGGGGGTGKNYLSNINNVNGNGNFELGATTKWSLFNTTLTSLIPTGAINSGAASITTFTATTSGKLAGTYSLSVASTGAITAGHGFITDAFTIDTEDQAKVMSFKASYSVVSGGSNLNFSGTSANTFAVYVYDVTNSQWIQPAGVYGMTQSSGVGTVQGTFQTSSNGTQYRLAVVCVNASAGAASLLFDSFSVGPNAVVQGTPVTDWQDYTLTIGAVTTSPTLGTTTINKAQWRRVGGNIQIRYDLRQTTSGSAGSGIYLFPLPPGLSIDSARIPGFYTGSNYIPVGVAVEGDVSRDGQVLAYSATQLMCIFNNNTANLNVAFDSSNYSLATADRRLSFYAEVPITGWSSSVQMSDSADTRVVAASYAVSSGQSISAVTATTVNFDSITFDTHNVTTTGAGWKYTVPVAGYYEMSAHINYNSTSGSNQAYRIYYYKNGTQAAYAARYIKTTGTFGPDVVAPAIVISCKAGDTLSFVAENDEAATTTGSSVASIKRVSGPSTIAATETVAWYGSAGNAQSLTSGVNTVANLVTDSNADTHGIMASNVLTAPVSGLYEIYCQMSYSQNTTGARQIYFERSTDGGSSYGIIALRTDIGNATTVTQFDLTRKIRLNAGDKIRIGAWQNSGGSLGPVSDGTQNLASFVRIGN